MTNQTPQSSQPSQQQDTDDWMRNTNLFKEWDRIKGEIMKHKWYESERAGRDIGWDRACVDWLVRHGRRTSENQRD